MTIEENGKIKEWADECTPEAVQKSFFRNEE